MLINSEYLQLNLYSSHVVYCIISKSFIGLAIQDKVIRVVEFFLQNLVFCIDTKLDFKPMINHKHLFSLQGTSALQIYPL